MKHHKNTKQSPFHRSLQTLDTLVMLQVCAAGQSEFSVCLSFILRWTWTALENVPRS